MSDFNGKQLVFRDDVEREFWGRVYAAEALMIADTIKRHESADRAVVAMRMRQGVYFPSKTSVSELRCAVCLAPDSTPWHHLDGCPSKFDRLDPHRPRHTPAIPDVCGPLGSAHPVRCGHRLTGPGGRDPTLA